MSILGNTLTVCIVVWMAVGQLDSARPRRPSWGKGLEANSGISVNCLACICKVEGCEDNVGCKWDVYSNSCGPYQIKEDYWIDCGKPGTGWQSCTKDMPCSQTCVRAYMARYAKICTGGRTPTCQDYARIHNGGPRGCKKSSTVGYWENDNKVKACCDKKGHC